MEEKTITQSSASQIDLLTKKQVAERLNVNQRTVDNLVISKNIPVYKIGGSIRFKSSDLVKLIENSLKPTV